MRPLSRGIPQILYPRHNAIHTQLLTVLLPLYIYPYARFHVIPQCACLPLKGSFIKHIEFRGRVRCTRCAEWTRAIIPPAISLFLFLIAFFVARVSARAVRTYRRAAPGKRIAPKNWVTLDRSPVDAFPGRQFPQRLLRVYENASRVFRRGKFSVMHIYTAGEQVCAGCGG